MACIYMGASHSTRFYYTMAIAINAAMKASLWLFEYIHQTKSFHFQFVPRSLFL